MDLESVISRETALEEENKKLKQLLTQAQKDMQLSLSSVSHELRNSLTLVMGSVQLLGQTCPEITTTDSWHSILSDLNYVKIFLQDLSSYKNIYSMKLNYQLCDLNAFLKDVCQNCQSWFDGVHHRLQLSCPDFPVTLYADRPKLYQALVNLVKNALEALNQEGSVSIRLRTADQEETAALFASVHKAVAIEIKDTGRGISLKQQDKIFQPFFTNKSSGTGLGLPIAQNIIKAHGGIIRIESTPGKGSVFTILLPRFPSGIE